MRVLKIKFVDFWFGFGDDNNYFYKLLSLSYQLELSDDPEILIYSCYGAEHLKYNCTRIFYTAENLRPDFAGCDFSITFDYNSDRRHFRLPLYAIYIDQAGSIGQLLEKKSREDALKIWKSKTKFCCMVVSNKNSKKRLDFFEKLSKYKTVDSGGQVMNNVGGPVKDKMFFIKDYRFVIAFENSSYPGYTTEKIVEPLLTDSIPVYWGNPLVSRDFNTGCFLNLNASKTEEELIKEIIAVDTDEEKAVEMLMEPKFPDGKMPADIDKDMLAKFFQQVVLFSDTEIPVSQTWKKSIHLYHLRIKHYKAILSYYNNRVKGLLSKLKENKV